MPVTVRCRCGRQFDAKEGAQTVLCPGCAETFLLVKDAGGTRLSPLGDGTERPQPAEMDLPEELTLAEPVGPLAARKEPSADPDEEDTTVEFVPYLRSAPKSWPRYLMEAWRYPFAGTAKWTLSFWLFCDLVFWLVFSLPLFADPGPFLMAVAPALMLRACLLAMLAFYEFSLVNRSAWDPDRAPSLPAFQDAYESLLRPIGLLVAAVVASAAPYYLLAAPANIGGLIMPAAWRYALAIGAGLFVFLLPMNLLAIATADQARALYPQHTLPAIARTFGPYLALCAFCTLVLGSGHAATAALVRRTDGSFLASLVREVVLVYLLTVCARALGTFYAAYSERINWLREGE